MQTNLYMMNCVQPLKKKKLFTKTFHILRKTIHYKGILTLLLIGFAVVYGAAQPSPVVVSADQPNIWTLEQAHYLIAQMHRRNLDLKASPLAELDANQINAINVDALKTLLSVSAEFDQSVLENNKTLKGTKDYQINRKNELITQRDNLQDNSLTLTRQIAELNIAKLRTKDDAEKKNLEAQVNELTIVKAAIAEQLTQVNSQINAISSDTTPYTTVNPTNAGGNLSSGAFDSILTATATKVIEQFNNTPQLNASLRLENYLQMQYEILSKQLTLLRDEVGVGERLIFLEVPQSINATYKKADNKWAQSWWKISGYNQCIVYKDTQKAVPCSKFVSQSANSTTNRLTTSEIIEQSASVEDQLREYDDLLLLTSADISDFTVDNFFSDAPKASPLNELSEKVKATENLFNLYRIYNEDKTKLSKKDSLKVALATLLNGYITKAYDLSTALIEKSSIRVASAKRLLPVESRLFRRIVLAETLGVDVPSSTVQHLKPLATVNGYENRIIRVVDLFPRQSSINVNDLKLRSSAASIIGAFKLISGIGAEGNYQRTRERYSQYVQQELYSSAFGKGGREFGWTFNPMPGTDRLMSGVRTTYAIAVIPEDATAIEFQTRGCYFSRKSAQPSSFDDVAWNTGQSAENAGCSAVKKFKVPIPDGASTNNNEIDVTDINYKSVSKGDRAVLTIYGKNFSSQIGVLVNGVPLVQALGIAQPFIRDDRTTTRAQALSEVPSGEVSGSFERVGSNQIIASFKMNPTYEGTPIITLVAPGKILDINKKTNIRINGVPSSTETLESAKYIFGASVQITGSSDIVSVDKVAAFSGNELKLIVTGKNLRPTSVVKGVYMNGQAVGNTVDASGFLITIEQDKSVWKKARTIQITILTPYGTINANPIDNPAFEAEKPERPQNEEISYQFDKYRMSVDPDPVLKVCMEKKDGSILASYEIKGAGLVGEITGYISNVQQDVKPTPNNRLYLTIKDPQPIQIVEIRDKILKLKDQIAVLWSKPQNCVKEQ